ncbi:MAG: GH3 auxin-responsive promoter family protein [Bacteroidota bacterium]
MKKRIHQIELFMKYPFDVQEEWLGKLLNKASETELGRLYGFSSIKNAEQFSKSIPLQTYESLKPYIERTRKGEQFLLWPEEIKWFAKSAGTTSNGRKLIPVSPTSLDGCHYNGGRDMVAIHCNNTPDTKLFTGKNLALGGTQQKEYFGDYESFIGDVSAIVISNLPMWAEYFRSPDVEIALIGDWEEKLERMALSTMSENVTSVAGVPCWMLLLFKRILEQKNAANIQEVWPNLEVYFHGGMNFTPYRNQFNFLLKDLNMSYLQLYNATEGFFGIQFDKDSDEMLLMLDYGIYYEFIPLEETEKESPKTVHLSQLRVGFQYEMVISTTAGLWRYRLGDVIQITSTIPYKFVITGRTRQCINVYGEKLMVQHAEQALTEVSAKFKTSVVDFTVSVDFENSRHEWYVELTDYTFEENNFIKNLDDSLRSLNLDYKLKRENDLIMKSPIIHFVECNTFYNWMKNKGKLGGQNKVPRLSSSREHIEDLGRFITHNN